jgi:hypothetical protein
VRSPLRYARADDAPNSHSADNPADTRAAPHSAVSPNTSAASLVAAAYSVSAALSL